MKLYPWIFSILIFCVNLREESQNLVKRLTYIESYDQKKTYYILNSEEEYKTIKNLQKNERYIHSSSYSYEWINHVKNTNIDLKNYLPPANNDGYRDMTKYDLINLNVFSKYNTGSKIVLIVYCQKRQPDSVSSMKFAYKRHIININFQGWKEIKIPYNTFVDGYKADLTRVSGFSLSASGWGCSPNKENELYIDKIYFTKSKFFFNMKESEISNENYSTILKRFKY